MEYIVVALMCFILGMIYNSGGKKGKLDQQLNQHLDNGKRVIIVIDDEATIYKALNDKIIVKRAVLTAFSEDADVDDTGYDLVSGLANESFDRGESGVHNSTEC